MSVQDKLIKYVQFDTQSDEDSATVPSTLKQLELAKELVKECEDMGFDHVELSDAGVVYARLDSNTDAAADAIGFIAHMDTAMEISGANVKPRIVKNYDGGTIVLNEEYSMSPEEFPVLNLVKGEDLIVTDGTTLLGADDKAGVAIIMQAMEDIIASGKKHGPILVAFTPDEEIGKGVDHFELDRFTAAYAYTVDGGYENGIEFETFNAAQAVVDIKGLSIHPGSAKDKMVNACLVAMAFNAKLPADQIPARTSGRQGFFHLVSMSGNVDHAKLIYILREHDKEAFEAQKVTMQQAADAVNEMYPGSVSLHIRDQYYNMFEYLKDDMRAVDNAKKAMAALGMEPISQPIRGGTDGAMLSARGLLCPNLGTGSGNHHGRYEFASIPRMNKVVDLVKEIVFQQAEKEQA